jgi:hypothetical protein
MLPDNSRISGCEQLQGFMRASLPCVRAAAPPRWRRFPGLPANPNSGSRKAALAVLGFENPSGAAVPGISGFPSRGVNGGGQGEMMRHLCDIGDLIRRLRIHARFGELSRAPLQLLRLELRGAHAECDWIARPPDEWDAELPSGAGCRNASLQALEDAIAVRGLLFYALPGLQSAAIRVYRQSDGECRGLIITGTVGRDPGLPAAVRSPAMRAKLFGFRFDLNEGVLENLRPEECAVNS